MPLTTNECAASAPVNPNSLAYAAIRTDDALKHLADEISRLRNALTDVLGGQSPTAAGCDKNGFDAPAVHKAMMQADYLEQLTSDLAEIRGRLCLE